MSRFVLINENIFQWIILKKSINSLNSTDLASSHKGIQKILRGFQLSNLIYIYTLFTIRYIKINDIITFLKLYENSFNTFSTSKKNYCMSLFYNI